MLIAGDVNSHAVHVPFNLFYKEQPIDFFSGNLAEYQARLHEARSRVLEAIRFAIQPPQGRGLNHELRDLGACIEDLTHFVDLHDRKLRKQRRRSLFQHSDIPAGYFWRISKCELDRFVELMCWRMIEAAIVEMFRCHELTLVNDNWHVKVSVMDAHRSATCRKPQRRVKSDDRSYHGRPRRDRQRQLSIL